MGGKKVIGNIDRKGQQTELERTVFLFLEGSTWKPCPTKEVVTAFVLHASVSGESGLQMGEPAGVLRKAPDKSSTFTVACTSPSGAPSGHGLVLARGVVP